MSKPTILLVLLYACLASTSELHVWGKKENDSLASRIRLQIVGGINTTIEKHPYQVSIYFDNEFFGAGSILNKKWIITTADSVNEFAWKFNIWTGSTQEHSGTKYKTDKIVFHPKYNNITRTYNLALVRISGSGIKFSEKVMSIEIAARPLKLGQVAITSGWGYTPERSPVFKELRVKRSKQITCKKHYGGYKPVTKSMICAVSHNAGPCLFDWGNPLVFRHKLVGVCSFYGDCGNDKFPGVYNSIHSSYWWIKKTIKLEEESIEV